MSWQPRGPETGHPGALLALGTGLSAWAPLSEPWERQPLRGPGCHPQACPSCSVRLCRAQGSTILSPVTLVDSFLLPFVPWFLPQHRPGSCAEKAPCSILVKSVERTSVQPVRGSLFLRSCKDFGRDSDLPLPSMAQRRGLQQDS